MYQLQIRAELENINEKPVRPENVGHIIYLCHYNSRFVESLNIKLGGNGL